MEKIKIITDSNSGLKQSEAENLGIFIIPMPFFINGKEYLEDISLSQEDFYKLLSDNTMDIHTSQPSRGYLKDLWDEILKTYTDIMYIPMSSGLSGTCESAKTLAEEYGGKVRVIDNTRISVTQKESVFEAITLLKQGKTAQEIQNYLEKTRADNSIYIMVDKLKYLKKGGRITDGAAAIGAALNIKPILYSDGGNFNKYAMAMSVTQAKKKMLEAAKKDIKEKFYSQYENGTLTVSVAHTQNKSGALKFKEEISAEFPNLKFRFVDALSLSVSCHIGPGALAIALTVNNYLD